MENQLPKDPKKRKKRIYKNKLRYKRQLEHQLNQESNFLYNIIQLIQFILGITILLCVFTIKLHLMVPLTIAALGILAIFGLIRKYRQKSKDIDKLKEEIRKYGKSTTPT